ncbi:MAG: hypothetical protein K8S24_12305 [Candidatus Aegiribacteria sp.]|nr:hypothetical protein [Candidatus Aegiribacteria sp.]
MIERKQYTKPVALNLSGFGVVGQEPPGICANGTMPTVANCPGGSSVSQLEQFCSPTGVFPEYGDCDPSGGNVINACAAGSLHT